MCGCPSYFFYLSLTDVKNKNCAYGTCIKLSISLATWQNTSIQSRCDRMCTVAHIWQAFTFFLLVGLKWYNHANYCMWAQFTLLFFAHFWQFTLLFVLQKYMPGKKVEDINHNYVECLLYTFHHLAHKVRFGHWYESYHFFMDALSKCWSSLHSRLQTQRTVSAVTRLLLGNHQIGLERIFQSITKISQRGSLQFFTLHMLPMQYVPPKSHVCAFLIIWKMQVNWNRRDSTSSLKETNSGTSRLQQGNIFSKNRRGKN